MHIRLSHPGELLFPRHCPFCDCLLAEHESGLCRSCAQTIRMISGPTCLKCGRQLTDSHREYCGDCRKREHFFIQGFAPFAYDGAVQESMMRFKYHGRAEYARFYAKTITTFGGDLLERWQPQMTAAVPVHPSRFVQRGYNQAEVLAEEVAACLGIPDVSEQLYRFRRTAPQKELTPEERRKNLTGVFSVRKNFRFAPRVLLIDDIYTTGATMDELAHTILAAGAEAVWFACIASSLGRS